MVMTHLSQGHQFQRTLLVPEQIRLKHTVVAVVAVMAQVLVVAQMVAQEVVLLATVVLQVGQATHHQRRPAKGIMVGQELLQVY
jgi:hypothetical protein